MTPISPDSSPAPANVPDKPIIKIFGVGSTGVSVLEQLLASGPSGAGFVAVNTDAQSLAASSAPEKVLLDTKVLKGLGTGGDPERGRELAEDQVARLKGLCEGAQAVFIIAGLGGGAGTGISPVLARVARETGALTLGFVTTPFDCEGSRRRELAQIGLEELKEASDGVISLPNQRLLQLTDENTSVVDAFKLANNLLAEGVRGIGRLLTHPGLIQIHFNEVCGLLRDRHLESVFAVADSMGATRSRDVLDRLVAHPMLEGGRVLAESQAVLVSFMGGPDLTMAEVNRVMEPLNQQCGQAQVLMGAAIEEGFRDRLAVIVVASCRRAETPRADSSAGEDLGKQLLSPGAPVRSRSRFVPPAPELSLDQVERLRVRPSSGGRGRKASSKLRQTQLPLEIVSKGRFDRSEPTIHKGENLDVPTYIRRGVALSETWS
jgi:cell division protein FtsZ